jgi:hypothetical protein
VGKVVAAGTDAEVRGRAHQRVEITSDEAPPLAELAAVGLRDPAITGQRYVGLLQGPVQPLLGLLARHRVASLQIEEPDLEEAFLDLFEQGAGKPA